MIAPESTDLIPRPVCSSLSRGALMYNHSGIPNANQQRLLCHRRMMGSRCTGAIMILSRSLERAWAGARRGGQA